MTAGSVETAELTEIQRALVDTAETFAAERLAPHAVAWDRDKHFPVDVLREAAKLGMAALYVAEEHGGTGLSRLDAVLVFEALATGCPSLAGYLSIHNMVAGMVDRHGSAEQRARYLPALGSMDELASYCLTEPDAGSDAAALRTTAVRDGEDWVLDGVKQFISGAGTSDRYDLRSVSRVRPDRRPRRRRYQCFPGGSGPTGVRSERAEDGVERPAHPSGRPARCTGARP